MTLPQIKGFLAAIKRKSVIDGAMFLSHVALGAQGSVKDIDKAVKSYIKSISKQLLKQVPPS